MKAQRDLISVVPCVITLIYVTGGIGSQIIAALGDATNISIVMVSLGLMTFLSWTCHGAVKGCWEVAIPNGVGALFSLILLVVCICH